MTRPSTLVRTAAGLVQLQLLMQGQGCRGGSGCALTFVLAGLLGLLVEVLLRVNADLFGRPGLDHALADDTPRTPILLHA